MSGGNASVRNAARKRALADILRVISVVIGECEFINECEFEKRSRLKGDEGKSTHRNPLSPGLNPYWLVAVSYDWMGNTSTNIPHRSKKKRKQKKKTFKK
jgi:hypothetical protein